MSVDYGTDPLCEKTCVYGTCRDPGRSGGPYGCGGCCSCLGGCQAAYEATLPEVTLPPKGCCDSCEGTGMGGPASDMSTNGKCSDCYGTGHLHNEGEPCDVPRG